MNNDTFKNIIDIVVPIVVALIAAYSAAKRANKKFKETLTSELDKQTRNFNHVADQQKRKLIADDIATARINWLQITRKYVSDYMAGANRCWDLREQYRKTGSLDDRDSLNDTLKTTESDYYKSLFSINPKEEIASYLEQYLNLAGLNSLTMTIELKKQLTEVVGNEVQKYFKQEWEKAKYEITNGKIYVQDNKNEELENAKKLKEAIWYANRPTKEHTEESVKLDLICHFGDTSNEYKIVSILYEINKSL